MLVATELYVTHMLRLMEVAAGDVFGCLFCTWLHLLFHINHKITNTPWFVCRKVNTNFIRYILKSVFLIKQCCWVLSPSVCYFSVTDRRMVAMNNTLLLYFIHFQMYNPVGCFVKLFCLVGVMFTFSVSPHHFAGVCFAVMTDSLYIILSWPCPCYWNSDLRFGWSCGGPSAKTWSAKNI